MKVIHFLPFTILAFGSSPSPSENPAANLAATASTATTTICDQIWMARNLDVVNYWNGDPIPEVQDQQEWVSLTTGAWCWYNNDSANYHHFGRLYNWYAVSDPRGLVPEGWHVPSDTDWEALQTCLGDSVGYRMRVAGGAHWSVPTTQADNSSGFAGLRLRPLTRNAGSMEQRLYLSC